MTDYTLLLLPSALNLGGLGIVSYGAWKSFAARTILIADNQAKLVAALTARQEAHELRDADNFHQVNTRLAEVYGAVQRISGEMSMMNTLRRKPDR